MSDSYVVKPDTKILWFAIQSLNAFLKPTRLFTALLQSTCIMIILKVSEETSQSSL